jgi:hypothetical protein
MIGPPPTYYDADQESQPQTQDFSHWIDPYSQVFASSSLYPSQPPTTDPGTERHVQPTQHRNQYQFVNSQPASNPHTYDMFPSIHFDGSTGSSRTQQDPSRTQTWQSIDISQPSTSADHYNLARAVSFPDNPQGLGRVQSFPFPSHSETVPRTVFTPPEEATTTLASTSASRSPAVVDQPLPTGSSNPSTTITFDASPKQEKRSQTKHRSPRKRLKSETDSDDDEDPQDLNVGGNLPRPNRL